MSKPFFKDGKQMRIVSIKDKLLNEFSQDKEFLKKTGRPCVLVIRLKYKGSNRDFAVPIRSNIPSSAPKREYFSLPPRPSTRPKNRHGLHYIKMFPVSKKYLERYRTEGNEAATRIQNILDKNTKIIISSCQEYLNDYENGIISDFATDLDLLIEILEKL